MPVKGLIIRELRREDIPILADIIEENWDKDVAANAYLEMQEAFLSSSKWLPYYFVAEYQGIVVGHSGFRRSWIMSNTYELIWVNIRKDCQGIGIGAELTKKRLNSIQDLGGTTVLTITQKFDFFSKFGFERVHTLQGVDGKGDWYLMVKQLGLVELTKHE